MAHFSDTVLPNHLFKNVTLPHNFDFEPLSFICCVNYKSQLIIGFSLVEAWLGLIESKSFIFGPKNWTGFPPGRLNWRGNKREWV